MTTTIALDTRPLGDAVAEVAELRAAAQALAAVKPLVLQAIAQRRNAFDLLREAWRRQPLGVSCEISFSEDLLADELVCTIRPAAWSTGAMFRVKRSEAVRA